MKAFLNCVSFHLPTNSISNSDIMGRFPQWSIDKISEKTGINRRYIAEKDEFSSDLGILASKKLFVEHNVEPNSIDFLLFCTQSPDYFLPTSACIIQDKLSLRKDIGAFDFNLGCSGYVYGLSIAKGMILAGIATKVLLITAETYSKFIHSNDKGNISLFGDGATASIISNKRTQMGAEIKNFVLGTDGKGFENLIVKVGGMRHRNNNIEIGVDINGDIRSDSHLYMNGKEIFHFTSKMIPKLVERVLEKNNLSLDSIDLHVFHQANKFMLNFIRNKIGIPESKFYSYLENCGNTVSSTIPIALYNAYYKEKKIKKKSNVLIAGFGVGYSWGSTVIKF